jgi:hypothetical protein
VVHHTNFTGFVVSALALKRQLQTILTRHFWIGELLVLRIDQGNNNQQIARELEVHRETVQQWRSRWLGELPRLTAAEVSGVSDKQLLLMIEEVLSVDRKVWRSLKNSSL